MKKIRCTLLLMAMAVMISTSAYSQAWEWAIKPIGQASTNFSDNSVVGVAIDNQDNSYIVGQFNDSATFSTIKMKSVNVLDIYIAKLNASGQLQWVKTIGGPGESDMAIDVAVDPNGNAYMAGYFYDSLDFDGTIVNWGGSSFIALAKYNSDGVLQWARLAEGLSIAVWGGLVYSPTGHIYLGAGHTLGKYELDGDTVWTSQVPLVSNSFQILDVAVDKAGNFIYATGVFSGSCDVGGFTLNSGGLSNWDIFVVKYDNDGNVIWARQAGSSGLFMDMGRGIEVDQDGNVYVCGQFTGTSYFSATDSLVAGGAIWSMFLAKYDSDGEVIWLMGGSGDNVSSSQGAAVRLVSNESAVLVASSFSGAVTFGGSTYSILGGDALMLKVSTDGVVEWAKQSGSTLAIINVSAMDVNSTTSTAVVVGNHYAQQATFTPFVFTTPPVGVADGFIVGMSTDSPTPVEERPGALLPEKALLAQNYPNPFNPSTTISFDIPRRSHVNITVYNVLGQQVRKLMDETVSAGAYEIDWDGRDDNGNSAATGVYMYRIQAGDYSVSKKMVLVK